MSVVVEPTPNPNAMKFSVGRSVGGPGTYMRDSAPEGSFIAEIVTIAGVASVFLTADFVTISKAPSGSWDEIVPAAREILESHFED